MLGFFKDSSTAVLVQTRAQEILKEFVHTPGTITICTSLHTRRVQPPVGVGNSSNDSHVPHNRSRPCESHSKNQKLRTSTRFSFFLNGPCRHAAADGFYTVALREYTIKYYIFIFRPCKFVQTTRLAAINSLFQMFSLVQTFEQLGTNFTHALHSVLRNSWIFAFISP